MIAKGNVEIWLGDLQHQQQRSLHGVIREAFNIINDSNFQMLDFLNQYQAQVM